jgi:hypothetical protein
LSYRRLAEWLRISGGRNPDKNGAKWGIRTLISSAYQQRLRKGCNHISKIEHNRSYLVSLNDIKEGAANFFFGLFAKPKCRRIEI